MSKDKETTGVWMGIDVGLKSLMDFVTQLSGKSRKDYVTELIEDDVYNRLKGVPNIEGLLSTLETRFPGSNYVEAFNGLQGRVMAREVQVVAMPADVPAGN
jgi:hypothetical protein